MRPEISNAERAKETRDAARAWHVAGFMTADSLTRILALYPDDRQRFGRGFRVLAFVFTCVAIWAIVGVSAVIMKPSGDGETFLFIWAVILALATEVQIGPWRRADAGAESATALSAVVLAVVAGTIAFGHGGYRGGILAFLASGLLFCAVAAWRWGDRASFLGAGLAGFALMAQVDQGRSLWVMTSVLLIPACIISARDIRIVPSHRAGAVIVGAVAILALYGAIHIWSLDEHLIESLRVTSGTREAPDASLRALSIIATGLLPPLLLVIGWRRREPLLLYAGLLLVGASIVTIRLYHSVMPLSFALILVGAACLALAVGVRRWLRLGAAGERDGFTADPLFDRASRTEAIRTVVAMASFTPAVDAAPARPSFEGGGGGFGGGGASGTY